MRRMPESRKPSRRPQSSPPKAPTRAAVGGVRWILKIRLISQKQIVPPMIPLPLQIITKIVLKPAAVERR